MASSSGRVTRPSGAIAAAQALLDGVRLLVDLLEREVGEAALLGGVDAPVDLGHVAPLLRAVERDDARAVRRDVGDVALVEDDDVLRVLEDRRHVAGDEALPVTEADDERHVHAGTDDPVGMVGVHDADGVGAAHVPQREPHRLDEVAGVLRLDEVGQHLGVGVGDEPMPLGRQAGLDLGVVLDDAVVDERQLAGAVGMRMRVRVVRRPVGRPARVADAGMARRAVAVEVIGEVRELAGLLLDEDGAVIGPHGDAGRVVAAVLEPPQALDQDRRGVTRTDVSDDPAHVTSLAVRRC